MVPDIWTVPHDVRKNAKVRQCKMYSISAHSSRKSNRMHKHSQKWKKLNIILWFANLKNLLWPKKTEPTNIISSTIKGKSLHAADVLSYAAMADDIKNTE